MKILATLILMLSCALALKAQTAANIILTGVVHDATGAVIPKAPVTAIDENSKKYETVTDDEGVYKLILPVKSYDYKNGADFRIAKYSLTVDLTNKGFENFVLKDFKLVSSASGKMNLDVALDANNQDNCGAGGCLQPVPAETANQKATDKILQKPLGDSPKEQNKPKRKNKK